jgi:hypothetical protein
MLARGPGKARFPHVRRRVIGLGLALSLLSAVGIVGLSAAPASATAPAPSWWKDANGNDTVCDTAHNPGSYALGASYNGVKACGPGPTQGGTDYLVHFYQGAWGEYEWECVELVMRYMYLVYSIAPYSANGYQVVSNYSGTTLTKVTNNGASVPSPGDILAFNISTNHPGNGHTAVVTAVNVDGSGNGTVTTMEENAHANGVGSVSVTNKTLGDGVSAWLHDPSASPTPNGAGNVFIGTDQLTSGGILYPNRFILSSDDRFLLILQGDGNLVEYGLGYQVIWSSNTSGRSVAYATLQASDGNFVLYSPSGSSVWSTGTAGQGATKAVIQSDGAFALVNSSGTQVWSNGHGGQSSGLTAVGSNQLAAGGNLYPGQYLQSSDKRFSLVMQSDGNLVLYGPAFQYLWASSTNGQPVAYATLQQSDGNFVLYDSNGTALWNWGAAGSGATKAVVQADGNFVLANSSGTAVKQSGTGGKIVNAGSSLSSGGTLWPNYYLLSPDTRFMFIQQSDGNAVVYDYKNAVLWQNSKAGTSVAYTALQTDGNFVEYNTSGGPIWYTGTTTAAHANMQSDGNFVLYNASWSAVWQTNTGGH